MQSPRHKVDGWSYFFMSAVSLLFLCLCLFFSVSVPVSVYFLSSSLKDKWSVKQVMIGFKHEKLCKMIIFFLKVLSHLQTTPTTIQTAIAEHKQYQHQKQEWKWKWSSRISIQNRITTFWQSEMGTEQHCWLKPVVSSPTYRMLHWRVEQILCISTLSQMAVTRVLVGASNGGPYSHHRWVAIKYKSHLYKPNWAEMYENS